MSEIITYSISTVIACLVGAVIPYYFKWENKSINIFLAISAGIIFGIACFYLVPEVYIVLELQSLIYIQLGFLIPLFLDYLFKSKSKSHHSDHHSVINIITAAGFIIHSMIDGFVLNMQHLSSSAGHATFLGILLHKVPVAFSLFALLKSHIKSKRNVMILFFTFVLMTPIGAFLGLYLLEESHLFVISAVGAFTAGMFIYIAFLHLFIDHELYKERKLILVTLLGLSLPSVFSLFHLH